MIYINVKILLLIKQKKKKRMKSNSFQCFRSINNQLHNKMSQQNEYGRYLKRINKIVDRQPAKNTQPDYINFLHKCKSVARDHHNSEEMNKIVVENKHLLDKILKNRTRRFQVSPQTVHLAMHEKRNREIQKINQQNRKIAQRITDQYSTLGRTNVSSKNFQQFDKSYFKKNTSSKWNFQPVKPRKLPKLVNTEAKQSRIDSPNQTKYQRNQKIL